MNCGRKCSQKNKNERFTKKYFRLLFPSNEPLEIIMEGLEIMNDDPNDVHVLYAKVHLNPQKYNHPFQRLANALSEALTKAGLF